MIRVHRFNNSRISSSPHEPSDMRGRTTLGPDFVIAHPSYS